MFHRSIVEEETCQLPRDIFEIPQVAENFALAGGTSLALQIGHRRSFDLDVFSFEKIDTHYLEALLRSEPELFSRRQT